MPHALGDSRHFVSRPAIKVTLPASEAAHLHYTLTRKQITATDAFEYLNLLEEVAEE